MKRSSLLHWLLTCIFFISIDSSAQSITKIDPGLEKSFAASINTPTHCEAYPYLSDDGLRLYFTTDRKGGFGMLYYCSRHSVNENFGEPKPLSKKLVDGFYAATFTTDELTIYASKEGDIYVAKRNSLNDEFQDPVLVKGLAEGRKFAPSISPDGNELIILLDISKGDVAIHYRKNGAGDFIEINRMKGIDKTELDPGQFSKDGLSFYASCDVKNDTQKQDVSSDRKVEQKIIRFTRKSLKENFITVEEVREELNFEMRNHQPTMNKDETIFVVVSSETDSWGQNELRLVNLEKEIIIEDALVVFELHEIEPVDRTSKIKVDSAFEVYPYVQISQCKFSLQEPLLLSDSIFTGPEPATSKSPVALENISQVKVYPNPLTDNIVVTLEKNDVNSNFELFDIAGKRIMTSKLNNPVNRIQFNRTVAGVYVYRITNNIGKVVASGKLVKK